MAHNPVFPLYYNDFDRSTKDWTDEEVGFFIRLLMHQWAQGTLPKEPERLQRIVTSLSSCEHILKEKFIEINNKLINQKLEEIRSENEAFSQKQRANINKRWNKKNTKTIPDEYQNDTKSIPNDIPNRYLHNEVEVEEEVEEELGVNKKRNSKKYNKVIKSNLKPFADDLSEKTLSMGVQSKSQKELSHEPLNTLKNDFSFDGEITAEKTEQISKIESEITFEHNRKPYSWQKEKTGFLENEVFMYKICYEKNLEKLELQKFMTDFINDIEIKQDYKPKRELQIHFTNYLNKKTSTNGTTQFPTKPKFKDLLQNAGNRLGKLGDLTGKDLDSFFK